MTAVLFASGAGQPQSAPWMRAWATRLSTIGPVTVFDWPYLAAGRKRPDPHGVLVARHREALDALRAAAPGEPLVAIGKSMGGRIGCHLSLEAEVDALVCLGYPLIGPSGKRRDEVLRALTTPVLFVQGTRDPMAPIDELNAVRATMSARTALHVVPTGDHSLLVTKAHQRATGRSQEDEDAAVLSAIRQFLREVLP